MASEAEPKSGARLSVGAALARLHEQEGRHFAEFFTHGSLSVEIYAPRGVDLQQPHRRDEVYVIIRGSGVFFCGTERMPFGAGDLLFVPAGVEHRFERFSEDFATWVMFYGPDGGEAAA